MSGNPAIGQWLVFARTAAKAAADPGAPCPDLAGYAQDMMKVTPPVLDLGDRALFVTLRYAAQSLSWSAEERRRLIAGSVHVIATWVAAACERLGPAEAEPALPSSTALHERGPPRYRPGVD